MVQVGWGRMGGEGGMEGSGAVLMGCPLARWHTCCSVRRFAQAASRCSKKAILPEDSQGKVLDCPGQWTVKEKAVAADLKPHFALALCVGPVGQLQVDRPTRRPTGHRHPAVAVLCSQGHCDERPPFQALE